MLFERNRRHKAVCTPHDCCFIVQCAFSHIFGPPQLLLYTSAKSPNLRRSQRRATAKIAAHAAVRETALWCNTLDMRCLFTAKLHAAATATATREYRGTSVKSQWIKFDVMRLTDERQTNGRRTDRRTVRLQSNRHASLPTNSAYDCLLKETRRILNNRVFVN